MQALKKIVIIGPESTGKSTLCQMLASEFHTIWCPEFAREYLLKHGTDYTYNQLLEIAKGQLALEDEYANRVTELEKADPKSSPLLFIDTDMYVMKVWCEFVFNNCHDFILEQIASRKYDLYLLCNIDLPWVKDELREYPDLSTREKLYHIYKDLMINSGVNWVDISGNYAERFEKAKGAVKKLKI